MKTVAIRAMAMPTEQSTKYFQAASRLLFCPERQTSGTVVSVVSSMLTHMIPRLSARHSIVIVPKKT
jgi:hypothetical protein